MAVKEVLKEIKPSPGDEFDDDEEVEDVFAGLAAMDKDED